MSQKSQLINIFCSKLPGSVTRPLYQEYEKRLVEIHRIWAKQDNNYKVLMNYESTVRTLLAASLFYRYVLGHLGGAAGFYRALNKQREKECQIKIGNSTINKKRYNQLLGVTMVFSSIQSKYQIPDSFFVFSETLQFMRNCKDLYLRPEYEEDDAI